MVQDLDQIPAQVHDFLLAELGALREQRASLNDRANNEITVFFAAVTAAGAILALIYPKDATSILATDTFMLIALGLVSILIVLGIATFLRLTSFRAENINYVRSLNRVRKFYIEKYSNQLEEIVVVRSPDNHEKQEGSKLRILTSNPGIIAVINTALVVVWIGIAINRVTGNSPLQWATCIVSVSTITVFVVGILVHAIFQGKMIQKANRAFSAVKAATTPQNNLNSSNDQPPAIDDGAAAAIRIEDL